MTSITLKLTPAEVELLGSLAADQLFRREFIDPRLPGHRTDSEQLKLGKQLVERLRIVADRARVTGHLSRARLQGQRRSAT